LEGRLFHPIEAPQHRDAVARGFQVLNASGAAACIVEVDEDDEL
jgi:hypothetical protein